MVVFNNPNLKLSKIHGFCHVKLFQLVKQRFTIGGVLFT
jgi:hypothetical protein